MRDDSPTSPPDYVSAETLAYRLDCSRATVDAYVRAGRRPKPGIIGNPQLRDFAGRRAIIRAWSSHRLLAVRNGVPRDPDDLALNVLKHDPPRFARSKGPPRRRAHRA